MTDPTEIDNLPDAEETTTQSNIEEDVQKYTFPEKIHKYSGTSELISLHLKISNSSQNL